MTSKDHEFFARLIFQANERFTSADGQEAIDWMTERLLNHFQRDNPRFDRIRFSLAAGLPLPDH